MHFFVPFLATAALTSAHVLPRDTTGNFTITNATFTSSTYSKTTGTTLYSFKITDSLGGGSTSCSASFANNQRFPPLNLTACNDPTWSFSLLPTGSKNLEGQYQLYISRYQVIDGHRTNNETSCNLNDVPRCASNMNPENTGSECELDFGGSTFSEKWAYTNPTKMVCPK